MSVLYFALALMFAGLALLCIEAFMPGFGICGISGALLLAASCAVVLIYHPFGIFIVLGEVSAVGLIFYILFKLVGKRQLYGKLILNETLNTEEADIGDIGSFLGKEGVTITSLRPFGRVDFNGVVMEVCSDGGYIAENKRVGVTYIDKQRLIVKERRTN